MSSKNVCFGERRNNSGILHCLQTWALEVILSKVSSCICKEGPYSLSKGKPGLESPKQGSTQDAQLFRLTPSIRWDQTSVGPPVRSAIPPSPLVCSPASSSTHRRSHALCPAASALCLQDDVLVAGYFPFPILFHCPVGFSVSPSSAGERAFCPRLLLLVTSQGDRCSTPQSSPIPSQTKVPLHCCRV